MGSPHRHSARHRPRNHPTNHREVTNEGRKRTSLVRDSNHLSGAARPRFPVLWPAVYATIGRRRRCRAVAGSPDHLRCSFRPTHDRARSTPSWTPPTYRATLKNPVHLGERGFLISFLLFVPFSNKRKHSKSSTIRTG